MYRRQTVILMLMMKMFIESSKAVPVGGQAVIGGVLMKGKERWGLAVRRPTGEIYTEKWPYQTKTARMPYKLPIIRGFVVMCEMLVTGMRALSRSAEVALESTEESLTLTDLVLTVLTALIGVVGLFIALPLWLAGKLASVELYVNITEGILRGVIFVMYVALIGLWPDIREVFKYHGAEHKTINAYESGLELTGENVMKCSRLHVRCGTSFMLIAVLVSIIIFSPLKAMLSGFVSQVLARVILIPLVIGLSYELIRLASSSGKVGKCMIWPFMSLQYLTTREPDIEQAEVGIVSLEAALCGDEQE